jgi:hypothetical protein
MKWLPLLAALAVGGCMVDGRSIVGPEDPEFAALCADSTLTDSTKVCIGDVTGATVDVVIANPWPAPDTAS